MYNIYNKCIIYTTNYIVLTNGITNRFTKCCSLYYLYELTAKWHVYDSSSCINVKIKTKIVLVLYHKIKVIAWYVKFLFYVNVICFKYVCMCQMAIHFANSKVESE